MEHPAGTRVKFPHEYYDIQAAIQMFHETPLAQSCHYIRHSSLICTSNEKTFYFLVLIFRKDLIKILYFPKRFIIFFLRSLFLWSCPKV